MKLLSGNDSTFVDQLNKWVKDEIKVLLVRLDLKVLKVSSFLQILVRFKIDIFALDFQNY